MWNKFSKNRSAIVVTLYWGGAFVKRIQLQKTGHFTVGLQSNIGLTFPHPTLTLNIVDDVLWFEHQQIRHPCTRNVWAYAEGECLRCDFDFKPAGQSLWRKQHGGFLLLSPSVTVADDLDDLE